MNDGHATKVSGLFATVANSTSISPATAANPPAPLEPNTAPAGSSGTPKPTNSKSATPKPMAAPQAETSAGTPKRTNSKSATPKPKAAPQAETSVGTPKPANIKTAKAKGKAPTEAPPLSPIDVATLLQREEELAKDDKAAEEASLNAFFLSNKQEAARAEKKKQADIRKRKPETDAEAGPSNKKSKGDCQRLVIFSVFQ